MHNLQVFFFSSTSSCLYKIQYSFHFWWLSRVKNMCPHQNPKTNGRNLETSCSVLLPFLILISCWNFLFIILAACPIHCLRKKIQNKNAGWLLTPGTGFPLISYSLKWKLQKVVSNRTIPKWTQPYYSEINTISCLYRKERSVCEVSVQNRHRTEHHFSTIWFPWETGKNELSLKKNRDEMYQEGTCRDFS